MRAHAPRACASSSGRTTSRSCPTRSAGPRRPRGCGQLGGQRDRWHRGLTDTLVRHRRMIFNPRYGAVGMVGLPFFVLFEFLGAFIEAVGLHRARRSASRSATSASRRRRCSSLVAVGSGVCLSLSALLLEDMAFRKFGRWRDFGRLVLFCVIENFGYRQLMTYYRVRGFVSYLRGDDGWGHDRPRRLHPRRAAGRRRDALKRALTALAGAVARARMLALVSALEADVRRTRARPRARRRGACARRARASTPPTSPRASATRPSASSSRACRTARGSCPAASPTRPSSRPSPPPAAAAARSTAALAAAVRQRARPLASPTSACTPTRRPRR